MTGQQPYEVAERRDGFELRRYPAHLVAEIEVGGSFDEAPDRAFGPLAGFINGANRTRRQIAITAPVTQREASPETIAMTSPGDAAGHRPARQLPGAVCDAIALHHPDTAGARRCPGTDPGDPRQLAAAARFSGLRTRNGFEERAAALRQAVVAAGLRPAGPVRYARFNPPWTPWFLRRNEVVQPVKE